MSRILLMIGWAIAQPVALLIGGWALLGASYGKPGTSLLGLGIILLPGVLLAIGLIGGRRDPAHVVLWQGLCLAGMIAIVVVALAVVGGARP